MSAALGVRLRRVALRQSYAFCARATRGYRGDQLLSAAKLLPTWIAEREFAALRAAHARSRRADGRRDRGGIDLSLGAIVSMANVIIVTLMAQEPSSSRILLALGAGLRPASWPARSTASA